MNRGGANSKRNRNKSEEKMRKKVKKYSLIRYGEKKSLILPLLQCLQMLRAVKMAIFH